MIVSFDIDCVICEGKYMGDEAWENGGREYFYDNIRTLNVRWPSLIPYINRLARHHVVQFNSAREPGLQYDTRLWVIDKGFDKRILVNCLGHDKKEDYLKALNPALHFDDNPKFKNVPGFVHVWADSWSPTPLPNQVKNAEEIIERIHNEKNKRYNEDRREKGSSA